ncbi:nucleoside-diphosphate kinase [Candidatus Thorarchaeota archaeon]|nr:MAG: nucleoside-diphosphate kinase [Candidatus Thorarchaeota archaeon]
MERSLVIIKPDATVRRRIGALVIKALMDRDLKVVAFKEMNVPDSLAKLHYDVHKDKPFFPWLIDFISSAPVITMILEGENAIEDIRDALGATFVQKADSSSLRGKYGVWAGINIAHASDAPDTATKEIMLWKEEGGLEETDDAQEMALDYIRKYSANKRDYTSEIRNTVNTAIEREDTSEDVLQRLIDLLSKDAEDITEEEINNLARVVFDYIKEEVE